MAATLERFVKATTFYGARAGYVYKLGTEGLGYYLEDARRAALRKFEGEEGPDIPTIAPPRELVATTDKNSPADPRPKPSWDPYADLPAPKKPKTEPVRTAAAVEPSKQPVRVFAPGLFKIEQVRCLHIVRKHAKSRNPTSWRAPATKITRTLDDAIKDLRAFRDSLLAASDRRALFEDLAKTRSECSSAKRGGDLGFFKRGKMNLAFEQAAFNLEIGDLSNIVTTSSGVHLILRIG
ncbi:hypothetical protein CTAYLR_000869 [Chrysophaeum taylorii]|uniref:Peptidyl-prolyl cis-trans isomerase n=1 Tax=Chrysophaeum taylorii TaxID=2483200 RepID=A0AAD7UQA7_9STRA|nr:hypothetical protein CTAYLR_000869 [Chrysophaeum taylorii]